MADPGRRHKPRGGISYQHRRGESALDRQKNARSDLQAYARQLALNPGLDVDEHDDSADSGQIGGEVDAYTKSSIGDDTSEANDARGDDTLVERVGLGEKKTREWYSQQLMMPEWMLDVPANLQQDWYALSRTQRILSACLSTSPLSISFPPPPLPLHPSFSSIVTTVRML